MRRPRSFIGPGGMAGMVGLWGTNSLIRSVQSGVISLASGSSSNTATIAAVNIANTVVFHGGQNAPSGAGDQYNMMARVELTNSTTVTAAQSSSYATATKDVAYTVIEFAPGVLKSVQSGTITVTGASTSNTATITSVDTNKSVVLNNGFSTTYNGIITDASLNGSMRLTNATTVTFAQPTGSTTRVGGYLVLEFY